MEGEFSTDSGYRFKPIKHNHDNDVNWVFLPGGPGLGSKYFLSWVTKANFPGNVWLLDFPGDGSNIIDGYTDYSTWYKEFVPALSHIKKVILVTHSFSGMFSLTIPELENSLEGLVIIGAAPNSDWRLGLTERIKKQKIPDTSDYRDVYNKDKNDANFKAFTIASWMYFMNDSSKELALSLLEDLPYNYKAYEWAEQNFHSTFKSSWIPQKLPTLILSGSDDVIMPLSLFRDNIKFNRKNIYFRKIKNASHFPWIEKPNVITNELINFYETIKTQ